MACSVQLIGVSFFFWSTLGPAPTVEVQDMFIKQPLRASPCTWGYFGLRLLKDYEVPVCCSLFRRFIVSGAPLVSRPM